MGGPETWSICVEEHNRREKLMRDFRLAHKDVPTYWTERDEFLRLNDYDSHCCGPCCCLIIFPVLLPAMLAFGLEMGLNFKQKEGVKSAVVLTLAGLLGGLLTFTIGRILDYCECCLGRHYDLYGRRTVNALDDPEKSDESDVEGFEMDKIGPDLFLDIGPTVDKWDKEAKSLDK